VIAVAVVASLVVGIRAVLRGGSVERAAAFTFVVFLLVNKVYSPQYTLWLFVMALVAEWPGWTLLLLSVVGLADYYGTFASFYITNASVPQTVVTNVVGAHCRAVGGPSAIFRFGGVRCRPRRLWVRQPVLHRNPESQASPVPRTPMGSCRSPARPVD